MLFPMIGEFASVIGKLVVSYNLLSYLIYIHIYIVIPEGDHLLLFD